MHLYFEYSGELGSESEVNLSTVERDLEALNRELDGPAELRTRYVNNELVADSRSPGKSQEFNEIKAILDEDTAKIHTAGDNYEFSPAATSLMEHIENVYTETIKDPNIKNWQKTTL